MPRGGTRNQRKAPMQQGLEFRVVYDVHIAIFSLPCSGLSCHCPCCRYFLCRPQSPVGAGLVSQSHQSQPRARHKKLLNPGDCRSREPESLGWSHTSRRSRERNDILYRQGDSRKKHSLELGRLGFGASCYTIGPADPVCAVLPSWTSDGQGAKGLGPGAGSRGSRVAVVDRRCMGSFRRPAKAWGVQGARLGFSWYKASVFLGDRYQKTESGLGWVAVGGHLILICAIIDRQSHLAMITNKGHAE